jgi:putative ABC transport system permease protein
LNPLPVVLADLRRSWGGFLAVVALIAVAVALGVAVSAQERAVRRGSARAADAFDLLVGAPGSPTQLVLTTVYLQSAPIPLLSGTVLHRLQDEPAAAYVAPFAFGDRYRGFPVVGSTVAFVTQDGTVRLAEGRPFTALHEAVIGADALLAVGDRFAPSHGLAAAHADDDLAEHHAFEYRVVGRLPRRGTPWDRAIIVPVEAVWAIHGLPTGHPDGDARIGPPWEANVPAFPPSSSSPARLRTPTASAASIAPRTPWPCSRRRSWSSCTACWAMPATCWP